MNINEALNALERTCESIAAEAGEKNLTATYKYTAANRDLEEVPTDSPSASLIAVEITLGAESSDETLFLEGAVTINEGEISEEEMLGEISKVKADIKDFYAKIEESGSTEAALEKIAEETEIPVPEQKTYDNRKFYIYGGIIAAVIIIVLLISKAI